MIKPCSRHSAELTTALRRKGMWQLVSTQAEEMQRRTRLWLEGTATRDDVDPLVITLLEIDKKGAEFGVPVEILKHSPIEHCTLCEVERALHTVNAGPAWIDNCTDAVLVLCLANGLVQAVVH